MMVTLAGGISGAMLWGFGGFLLTIAVTWLLAEIAYQLKKRNEGWDTNS